jgi:type VI protein secretion system component Hcp
MVYETQTAVATRAVVKFITPPIEGPFMPKPADGPLPEACVELLSFDLGLELAGGITTSRPRLKEVTLIKAVDMTSAPLMSKFAAGQSLPHVEVHVVHAVSGDYNFVQVVFTLKNVNVKKLDWDGREGDVPVETLTLVYTELKVEVKPNGQGGQSALYTLNP